MAFGTKHPSCKTEKTQKKLGFSNPYRDGRVLLFVCYLLLVLGVGDLFNNLPFFRYKASGRKRKKKITIVNLEFRSQRNIIYNYSE